MDRKRKVSEDERPIKLRRPEPGFLWRGHWEMSGGEWNYVLPDGRVVYYSKEEGYF